MIFADAVDGVGFQIDPKVGEGLLARRCRDGCETSVASHVDEADAYVSDADLRRSWRILVTKRMTA